jgi:hypothetical protein
MKLKQVHELELKLEFYILIATNKDTNTIEANDTTPISILINTRNPYGLASLRQSTFRC